MDHKKSTLVLVLGAASLGLASASQAQDEPRRVITRVTGDLYRAQNNNHNSAFLVTPEGIIVVDPLNPEFAAWLEQELNQRFGVPVRYVLYSHHHWDHASGGAVFADTADFVGHANMLSHLAMPPDSMTLPDVIGQYAPVAALDSDDNGWVDWGEASGNISSPSSLLSMLTATTY